MTSYCHTLGLTDNEIIELENLLNASINSLKGNHTNDTVIVPNEWETILGKINAAYKKTYSIIEINEEEREIQESLFQSK